MLAFEPRARPIVKWAGGKSKLVDALRRRLPPEYGTYHEPFVGGGAMLLATMQENPERRCRASDVNRDLIAAYECVRDNLEELLELLRGHAGSFASNRKGHYYDVRAQNPRSPVERAARLIFLNKTCFNGLYRVNSRGRFNVPIGGNPNPNIVGERNLRAVSGVLKNSRCSFECADFESALRRVEPGSFVYMDPPYQPVSGTGFTTYAAGDFDYDDLLRLARMCESLDSRGCRVMLSNSCSEKVTALFDRGPWNVTRMTVSRIINSDGSNRSNHCDVLIKNY